MTMDPSLQSQALHRALERNRTNYARSPPRVVFLKPKASETPVLFSLMNASEVAVKKFLPKSHLSRVIIRDNLSAQRLYELERRVAEKTKKKMSYFFDHLKKKFMTDQMKKMNRWRREALPVERYLESIHQNQRENDAKFKKMPLKSAPLRESDNIKKTKNIHK
ncbi:uncharacterized protein C5orf52 homolog [Monodelphis domestica]|uniref:uncharacterized protein C5orf52 homolog n=1 Tax=Monodelphis domestica TaxID=13616 RepID=UPI00028BDBEB|nr:uncharacterized protein C5orf52 homolog [Monodelphis domestica]